MATTTTPQALADRFTAELGERVLSADVAYDNVTITVTPEAWTQAVRYCKQTLEMTFFDWLSAVDERDGGFSVLASLYNHITREGVLLKVAVPGGREAPVLPTVSDVYAGANWHEREVYDMFGIVFDGHPGLLPRLLTVENFEGWPLRKDFLLNSREVKPWPGAKEPGGGDEEEAGAAGKTDAPTPGQDPGDRAAAAKAKAERAKAKAAEARKRKAEERAAALAAEGGGEAAPSGAGAVRDEDGAPAEGDPDAGAQRGGESRASDDAEPGSPREAAEAAAGRPTEPHDGDPTTPEGAATIADTDAAKDAAAGAMGGDMRKAPPGDQPDSDEPDIDEGREQEVAEGGPAQAAGAPGAELEGTHDLEESTARTADVSADPDPADESSREAHGLGPAGTGTHAKPTVPDRAGDTADEEAIADSDGPQEGDDDE